MSIDFNHSPDELRRVDPLFGRTVIRDVTSQYNFPSLDLPHSMNDQSIVSRDRDHVPHSGSR